MKPHPLYLKAARGEYLAPKDLATLIRDALKKRWPASKFSVTSSRGSGASIDIRWQDGPCGADVDAVVRNYKTQAFDGMIDLAHSNNLWIYPDGSAHCAHDSGTGGSMGSAPEIIVSAKRPDAVLLDNVASCYVFTQRSVTPRAYHRAIADFRAQNWVGCEAVDWDAIEVETSDYDGSGSLRNCPNIQPGNGSRWLSEELCRLARSYDLTEPEPVMETPRPVATPTPAATPHAPCLCW